LVVTTTLSVKLDTMSQAQQTELKSSLAAEFATSAGVNQSAVNITLKAATRRMAGSRSLASGETVVVAEFIGTVGEKIEYLIAPSTEKLAAAANNVDGVSGVTASQPIAAVYKQGETKATAVPVVVVKVVTVETTTTTPATPTTPTTPTKASTTGQTGATTASTATASTTTSNVSTTPSSGLNSTKAASKSTTEEGQDLDHATRSLFHVAALAATIFVAGFSAA